MIYVNYTKSYLVTFFAITIVFCSSFVHRSNTLILNKSIAQKSVNDLVAALGMTNLLQGKTNSSQHPAPLDIEDAHLNISQLIVKYGYNGEQHQVKTEDGYILTLFRMRNETTRCGRVVFLMHGFLSSADDWLSAGRKSCLACLLASKGFDVWMGNARGNKHSKKHETISPNNPKFWDFSWHEIGCYDLPAMIDYVLETTCQTRLTYVGHSQGTTTFFVMCSEKPEYNEKIASMISLSSVAYMSHVRSPFLRLISPLNPELHLILSLIGYNEFLPDNVILDALKTALCGTTYFPFCESILFLIFGFDYAQVNYAYSHVIFAHIPGGGSTKQAIHYAQEIVSGKFRKYDYGDEINMLKYGCVKPPEYAVEKITAPIYMYHANNDWLSNITDVTILKNQIPNVKEFNVVQHRDFCHSDYLYAVNVYELVHINVLECINNNT